MQAWATKPGLHLGRCGLAILLKDVYTTEYLARVGQAVGKHSPGFPVKRFIARVRWGDWKALPFKQRVRRLSLSLGEMLPANYPRALQIVVRAAGEGFEGYAAIFFPDFVEVFGRHPCHRRKSLQALEVLTSYSTAEYAIRAFLLDDLKGVLAQLKRWSGHPDAHIRRLSSEGARPRLPWAQHLEAFKRDPRPLLPILQNLKSDTSAYVRRSVANNLNDISKDHPDLALEVARGWVAESARTAGTAKHGLRTLLKSGHSGALQLLGCHQLDGLKLVGMELSSRQVVAPQNLRLRAILRLRRRLRLRLEYALYFLTARGTWSRKVFKISERWANGGELALQWRHSFRPLQTRRYYSGEHRVALIVNGREESAHSFELLPAYWVYVARTQKNKLYTGITTDLQRRLREHAGSPRGAKALRGDPPRELAYAEAAFSRSQALEREAAIKRLSRPGKEALLRGEPPRGTPPRFHRHLPLPRGRATP